MSITQEEKNRQVTEETIVVGVDIASETHWARAFDWRGLELGKTLCFANSAEGFAQMRVWAETIFCIFLRRSRGRFSVYSRKLGYPPKPGGYPFFVLIRKTENPLSKHRSKTKFCG